MLFLQRNSDLREESSHSHHMGFKVQGEEGARGGRKSLRAAGLPQAGEGEAGVRGQVLLQTTV